MTKEHFLGSRQHGFILVTVLFFLLMIGLLVLSLLNTTQLELRMSQNYSMASQQFQAAEAGLKIAEAKLALVKKRALREELSYAGYQIFYDIKRLSLPFCIDKQIAYYYRITAQALQPQQHALTLQTIYAKKTNKICTVEENKQIKEGRSGWRQFH